MSLCLVLLLALAGCIGADSGAPASETPVADTPTSAAEATATATPSATPSPTPEPERPALDTAVLETSVLAEVNAARAEAGLDPLERREDIDAAAGFHADNLATQGFVAASAGGYTAGERHVEFGVEHRCKVVKNDRKQIEKGPEVEVSGEVRSGETYTLGGESTVVSNETLAASVLVTEWLGADEEPLQFTAAKTVGIGANVTDSGRVFANVVVCA